MADEFIPFAGFGEPRPQARQAAMADMAGTAEFTALSDAEALDAQTRFKDLPPRPEGPLRLDLSDVIGGPATDAIQAAGRLVFHTVGDTGQRSHGAEAEQSVAHHMEQQVRQALPDDRPAFFYHLGDVIYFQGELEHYPEQFYEPYQFYPPPIFAIPGNHDGDNIPDENSLDSFVANFCTAAPQIPPMPGQARRRTMTEPYVYFTLKAPFATVIGLYANISGDLDRRGDPAHPQLDWLIGELQAADWSKFVIVAVHYPPYSGDDHHSSTLQLQPVLDQAIAASPRPPHLILAAHVHNYQRFERDLTTGGITRPSVPYLVAGAGGYAGYDGLHKMDPAAQFPEGVRLVRANDSLPGFLRITITNDRLSGEYFVTRRPPNHLTGSARKADTFAIPRLATGEASG